MTPNAFTVPAAQTKASRNDASMCIDESDGCCGGCGSWPWSVGQGQRLPCPVSGCSVCRRGGQREQRHCGVTGRALTGSGHGKTVLGSRTTVGGRCAGGEADVEVRRLVGLWLRGPSKEGTRNKSRRSSRQAGAVQSAVRNRRWRGVMACATTWASVSVESVERQNRERARRWVRKKERINRA